MSRYASQLAGRSYGSLGRVLECAPHIALRGYHRNRRGELHGLNRLTQRQLTADDVQTILSDPVLCFDQRDGTSCGFLSEIGFVAVTREGDLVTVYGRDDFDDGIHAILRDAGVE